MRRQYNEAEGPFSEFSSSLVAGDTAILAAGISMEHLSLLLAKGVVVRMPESESLDRALRQDAQGLDAIIRLAAVVDRRVLVQSASPSSAALTVKKPKYVLESKVHRLVVEHGFSVVEACRKVHCRASNYYIYRGKLKSISYGR